MTCYIINVILPPYVNNPGYLGHGERSSQQKKAAVKRKDKNDTQFWNTRGKILNCFSTHGVLTVVTDVVSTNKNGDQLPI